MTFGPHTVTVVQRGWDGSTRDRQNNPVITETGTFQLTGCWLQQRQTLEDEEGRETTLTGWVLFAPPPPQPIGHIDRFRIEAGSVNVDPDPGQTYATFEQEGHPDTLQHATGADHHLELILQRVEL